MNCKHCKTIISEKAKFCPECGKPVPKPEPKPEPQTEQAPPIMSVKQIASFLGISNPTVYRLIREGMPWFPVGGHKRFIRDEVVQWAKSRQFNKLKGA